MGHLDGIRIVSFNHFLMGPVGIQFLADLGAEVVAIEPIEGAFQRKWGGANRRVDGQTMLQLTGNRNKRSFALNLKSPEGVAIARQAHRSGGRRGRELSTRRHGEARPRLRRHPRRLTRESFTLPRRVSGPAAHTSTGRGRILIIQAMSGLAAITGTQKDGPRAIGVSAVDHHGAALFAAGILAALVRRERTGEGGRVDVNLLNAALDLQMELLVCFLNGDGRDDIRQAGSLSGWYFGAPYGVYATSDNFIAISLGSLDVLSDALANSAGGARARRPSL